jgi:hypothetical protein
MSPLEELEQALRRLVGLPCWNLQAGAIGSLMSLHIGEKIPLNKPLPYPNTQLSPDEHKYRGEYVLYVEDCPWRLDGTDAVIASWTDSGAPDSPLITGTRQLIGQRIEGLDLIRPGLDLILYFSNGLTLRVFPDQSDPDEGDNYSLSLADRTYIVAARSTVYVE